MNISKKLVALVMVAMAALPFAFGSSSDGFAQVNGGHFRSPYQSPTPAPRGASADDALADSSQTRTTTTTSTSNALNNDDSMFPPSAKPGECFTRVLVPPPTRSVTEKMLVKAETVRLVEIPAVLEEADEQMLVKPASERQEVTAATYKEVEERVMVSPAYVKQIPVPARFEDRTQRVLIKPERNYWKKGTGPLAKIDHTTGEIMCYVTDPAVYDNVTSSVQVAPATVRSDEVAAVYKTVTRTVIDVPASIKTVQIPAEYSTMKVSRVKSEARVDRQAVPAEYVDVVKQLPQGDARMGWRQIICETNVTPALVSDIQTSLNAKGYKSGEVTGELNGQTLKALESFQVANNLSTGGVTIESINALGVKI